jgi:cytochrome P450
MVDLLIYFALGVLCLLFFLGSKSSKNYPPGPWGIPILGHLPLLGTFPAAKITQWSKKYGPVMAIRFGSYPTVVISDLKLVKAAFNDNDFAGRVALLNMKEKSGGQVRGVIFTEGKEWNEQRRFILRTLRDFGFGKKTMESAVHDEIKDLIETFRKSAGKPQSTKNAFNAAVLNALWTLIAGERFRQDDPALTLAIKHLTTNVEESNPIAFLCVFIPILAKIAPKLLGYTKIVEGDKKIVDFIRKPVEEHIATWQSGQPRDFIDVYLDEVEKTENNDSSFHKDTGHISLLFSVLDLFIAGAETTSTTLMWAFLYMAKYPDVQVKVQAEIAALVGNSRLPSLNDRPLMPYAEAVIHEIMRFSSLVPIGVMHKTLQDVHFNGFDIPKDTMIFPNIYGIHFDDAIWVDPQNFRPERFLSEDGSFKRHEAFVPFSTGKRVCLGETLARDELFLFFTSLFQAFSVKPETTAEELSIEPHVGGVLSPKNHKLILTERN